MTQMAVSPARTRAHALSFVVPLLVVLGLFGGCAELKRPNGEACLKDQDCLTGSCSQLVCVAAPSLIDAEATGPGTATDDGGGEAGSDSGGGADAPAETASESGSAEAATDGGGG
jgi:hypothetical protein